MLINTETKPERLTIYIDSDLDKKVRVYAAENRVTISQVAIAALDQYFKTINKGKSK